MSPPESKAPLISSRVAVVLVLVSALTALGVLALSAYAPDLRSDRSGSTTVISKSAGHCSTNAGASIEARKVPAGTITFSSAATLKG